MTVIRVAEKLADRILDIARRADEAGDLRMREEPDGLVLQFTQSRAVRYTADKPINVFSVPQRSPFRYPGGKTWFVPHLRDWLRRKSPQPVRPIEPFAGARLRSLKKLLSE